ncbi:MAG TPA: hypothetical protein VND64_35300 [Pirellulales bacterium]|nr:hypothetical protein [Pirellulales bacterium]
MTLIVLIVVGTGIAVANLSSAGATVDFLRKTDLVTERAECPFGWPLAWYWRISGNEAEAPKWTVSRISEPCLIGNVAMWLAMLASTAVVCQWLLRRYPQRFRGRPHVSTLIPLALVAVPTVLANLSGFEPDADSMQGEYYGWPLIWYGHLPGYGVMATVIRAESWEYSAPGLVSDLLAWFLVLAVTGLTWEWLVRRYRPRFRWSLKTMLAAVGLVAVGCAWLANARNRAEKQDALIDLLGGEESFANSHYFYHVERWGPKWLDLVGADRLRRSIVGASVEAADADIEDLFKRLAPLPDLRFLDMASSFSYAGGRPQLGVFSRAMGEALGSMRQLRMLNVECERVYGHISTYDFHECMTAVGKLTQIELLGIHIWEENIDDLSCLDKLTRLKRLKLSVIPFANRERWDADQAAVREAAGNEHEKRDEPRTLARLPPLPRLEFLNLHEWELGDEYLDRLAGFPRLKSLDLSWTTVSAEGLAKLAPMDSLEELAINEDVATSTGFEALIGLKRLKALHVCPGEWYTGESEEDNGTDLAGTTTVFTLDDGSELVVLSGEFDGLRRALAALRQSHPGIVIDAAYEEFEVKYEVEAPWHGNDP